MGDIYQNLDPEFARRLHSLIAASGGTLRITDAFRTRAQQAALYAAKPNLAAPPGHSLHERGLAADLAGNLDWAHRVAAQYGLNFPMLNPSGAKYEPWHLQLAGAENMYPRSMMGARTGKQVAGTPAASSSVAGQSAPQAGSSDLEAALLRVLLTPSEAPWLPKVGYSTTPMQDQAALERTALEDQLALEQAKNAPLLARNTALLEQLKQRQAVLTSLGGVPAETPYTPPAAPTRGVIPLPAPAPLPQSREANIATAVLSLLAPERAGEFASANLAASKQEQAGLDAQANREFAYQSALANQNYADAERARQDQIQTDLINRDVAQRNALAEYQRRRELGLMPLESVPLEAEQKALGAIAPAQAAYAHSALAAQQGAQQIATNQAQRMGQYEADQKNRELLQKVYGIVATTGQRERASVRAAFTTGLKMQQDAAFKNSDLTLRQGNASMQAAKTVLDGLQSGFRFDATSKSWVYDPDLAAQLATNDATKTVVALDKQRMQRAYVDLSAAQKGASIARANAARRYASETFSNDPQKMQQMIDNDPEVKASLGALQTAKTTMDATRAEMEGKYKAPASSGGAGGKTLDKATAQALLREAGGDKVKARALARKRGYTF